MTQDRIYYENATQAQKDYIQSRIDNEIFCIVDYEITDAGLRETQSISIFERMENLYNEDDELNEPLEFYFVSEWLGNKLASLEDEPVLRDTFICKALWGRTCSGQSIILDPTFWDVFQDSVKEVE